MELTVKLFGALREMVGAASLDIELDDDANVTSLVAALSKDPRLERSGISVAGLERSFMVAVNQSYAQPSLRLSPRDEVAIIPPVSGG